MNRALALVLAFVVVAGACTRGDPEQEAAEDLAGIAVAGDVLDFKATYRYTLSGDLAPAVQTEMEIVQQAPTSIRRIETTTLGGDGERFTVAQWLVDREDGSFACAEYEEGVQCVRRAGPTGVFGYTQVDEILQAVRDPESFDSVQRQADARIAGERARCFEAIPPAATPAPARSPEPRFTPTRFELELCYSEDGIPLRARRTMVGTPEELEGRTESLLEAVSISREVASADLRMPGPVREED